MYSYTRARHQEQCELLENLWAPVALRGIEGEQTLGAFTVNNSLHLTHTSPAPIPGLLMSMEGELRKACAI